MVLQITKQMIVQMGPQFTQSAQIVIVYQQLYLFDYFVHAKAFVFVAFQLIVERFQRVGKPPEQNIFTYQPVDVLDVGHCCVFGWTKANIVRKAEFDDCCVVIADYAHGV